MGKNQHVVPRGGRWAVRGAGNTRDTRRFATQFEAIEHGRELARKQKSELVIHGSNGKIRDKTSYGSDSFPPIG